MFGILLVMSVGCGGGVFGAERRERLLTLARESDRIALEFSLVAAGFAETDECEEDGFESPIAWIKANCHMSGGAAADRVCAGEQLDRLDRSEAAMLTGEIGFAHFAHIARASAAVGERMGEDDHRLFPRRLGDALVELAEGSMQQPQIQVTSSIETLLGLAAAPAAEMEFALPISSKTVERFACDCGVTRILLGSESTVI